MTRPQLLGDNGTLFCDFRVNTTDCVNDWMFQRLWMATLVCNVISCSELSFLIGLKIWRGKFRFFQSDWTIRGNEGTSLVCFISSSLHLALCVLQAFQIESSQALKEFLFGFALILAIDVCIIYMFAIIRTLPDRYWDPDHQHAHRIYLPKASIVKTAVGPTLLLSVGLIELPIYIAMGILRDNNGNVQTDVVLFTIVMQMSFVKNVTIGLGIVYMFFQFSQIVRYLLIEDSTLNNELIRKEKISLSRAKRVFICQLFIISLWALGAFLLGSIYYVYQNTPLSIIAALCSFFIAPCAVMVNYTIETTGFLIYKFNKQSLGDDSRHSSESNSKSSRVRPTHIEHNPSPLQSSNNAETADKDLPLEAGPVDSFLTTTSKTNQEEF